MRQNELMFGESLVPPNRPNIAPMSIKRCSKCQDFGHTPSEYPNKEFITLAEWEAAMEEENEDKMKMNMIMNLGKLKRRSWKRLEKKNSWFWEGFQANKRELKMNRQTLHPLTP